MKRPSAVLCIVASLLSASTLHAQTATPKPPLRAASEPATASPAVQAAENTRMRGDVTPEKRPVPQISVPLKRKGTADAAGAAAAASRPTLDDEMARCLAQNSRHERARCTQVSKFSAPPAARPRAAP